MALQTTSAIPPETSKSVVTPSCDLARARQLFESVCSQCHETSDVEDSPPSSEQEARELVVQMVENGLSESKEDLQQIIYYLTQIYGKKKG